MKLHRLFLLALAVGLIGAIASVSSTSCSTAGATDRICMTQAELDQRIDDALARQAQLPTPTALAAVVSTPTPTTGPTVTPTPTPAQTIDLPTPTITRAVPGTSKFEIHWQIQRSTAHIDGWQVAFRAADVINGWRFLNVRGAEERSASYWPVTNGVTYVVFVRAYNYSGEGPWSNYVMVTPHVATPTPMPTATPTPTLTPIPPPTAPVIESFVLNDHTGELVLMWEFPYPAKVNTGYEVRFRANGGE